MEFSISSFLDILGIKPQSAKLLGAAVGVGAVNLVGTYLGIGILPYLLFSTGAAMAGAFLGEEIYIALENKRLGISPPKIQIQRKENVKTKNELQEDEEHNIFTLSNIKIIDEEVIQHATAQIIQHSDETSDPPVYNFNNKPTYSVKIKTNPGITLGELEYTNWENNPNYKVKVIDENGNTVKDSKTRQAVLTTLECIPKFLGTKYIDPRISGEKAIAPSSSGYFGTVTGWFKRNILRQTNLLEADPVSPCNPSLTSDIYFDNLVELGIKTGKYAELLEHYKNTLLETNKRSSSLKTEKLTLEGVLRGKEPNRVVTAVLAATAVIAGGASLFFLTGLNAIVGIGMGTAATLAVTTLGVGLPVVFAAIAVIALIAVIYRGWKHYKKYKLANEIKHTTSQSLRHEKELNKKFAGLKPTTKVIQNCSQTKAPLLEMQGKKIGDACATVISKWINSTQGKNCTEINLANNNITSEGAKALAQALKNSHIKSINLKQNPLLKQEDLATIKDALLENFTITNFQYDYNNSFFNQSISKQLNNKITKQLLINKYIQGDNIAKEMRKKHFGTTEIAPLVLAAIEKIKTAESLTSLQNIEIDTINNNKIKQALIERQITLIFATTDKYFALDQLKNYIHIYNHLDKDTFKIIEQTKVLTLLKNSLFTKEKTNLYITVPTSLKNIQHSARTDLLRRCLLKTHTESKDVSKHATGIANLLSALLNENFLNSNNPKYQKIQECIKQINTWDTTKSHWTFAQYIENLQAAKQQLSPIEQEKIDIIIQTTIEKDLATRFTCLRDKDHTEDFAQLQDELKTDVLFQKSAITSIDPKVATYIDNITKRNQLQSLLARLTSSQPATITNTFAEFLAIYKTMDPQYLTSPPIDEEKLKNLVTNDITDGTNIFCTQMRTLSSTNQQHSQNLLALCFKNEQNDREKAALITDLFGTPEVFDSITGQINPPYKDSLFNSFAWPRGLLGKIFTLSRKTGILTYSDLKNLLEGERVRTLKEGNYEKFEVLENLLQRAYQKELLEKHQGLTASNLDFAELKKQLDNNFDLRDSTITENNQASPEIIAHIKSICSRNIMLDIAAQYNRDKRISSRDLEDFITELGKLTKNYDLILSRIQPLNILKIIENDMGQKTQLSCINLKKLQQKNPSALTALLTRCFSWNDNANDASKKAFLVSSLLQFDALYQQNNKLHKEITYQLYYAIVTWGIISTGNYSFNQIEKALNKIKQNLETDDKLVQQGKQANHYPDIDANLRAETLAKLSSTLSQVTKITAKTPIRSESNIMQKLEITGKPTIEEKQALTKQVKIEPSKKPSSEETEEASQGLQILVKPHK